MLGFFLERMAKETLKHKLEVAPVNEEKHDILK